MSDWRKTTVATGALVGVSGLWWLYSQDRRERLQKIETPADLRHNFYAGGSDVIRFYNAANKIFLVTGTTSGLGRHTAHLLARAGAKRIIMGVRSVNEGRVVATECQDINTDVVVDVLQVDMASLASVQAFTRNVVALLKSDKIDGLVHNAGVYKVLGASVDGVQTTWQVNVLSPAYLTDQLWQHLSNDGRVVFVSSEMHKFCFGNIPCQCPPNATTGAGASDYALSKACQILLCHAYQADFDCEQDRRHCRALAVEPGLVRTNIGRHGSQVSRWLEYNVIGAFLLRTVDQGCASILYSLLAPAHEVNGVYIVECAGRPPKASCTSGEDAVMLRNVLRSVWQNLGF